MKTYFDRRQLTHRPERELHNGDWHPHAETPDRAEAILAVLGEATQPEDFGTDPIAAIHNPAYVDFLRSAHSEWRDSGRPGDAVAYTWPVVRRREIAMDRIDAKLGRYSYDAGTPIGEGTWSAAYWSAQCAIAAAADVAAGARTAFALCRPPGHHSEADYFGGYCYLNSAAIAAQYLLGQGRERVAILDIDYHHGNGTQDIFYDRSDVCFVSIHADPATDYPFYWGRSDERGEGDGTGYTLNLPLARGTEIAGFMDALETACAKLGEWGPQALVLSYGADTYAGDPISFFAIETAEYQAIGQRIAALGLPIVVVMEGGYAVEALGANVASLLAGIEGN
ncbi:histone deacetylase family protein [Qipengyuania sp. MTN3-11]|uniref:histone deacetylase family protein n=1 Tax=Qipengyuania sp. MTN3-11 TaxID=3056557 RepID=UPI0036F2D63D